MKVLSAAFIVTQRSLPQLVCIRTKRRINGTFEPLISTNKALEVPAPIIMAKIETLHEGPRLSELPIATVILAQVAIAVVGLCFGIVAMSWGVEVKTIQQSRMRPCRSQSTPHPAGPLSLPFLTRRTSKLLV